MVKRICFMLLVFPALLMSGEFTASVNRNSILAGDSITLNLTLKDASAKGMPNLDVLKQSFAIHSQQQATQTTMRNGHVSSNRIWNLVLTPLVPEGDLTIPSISILSSDGVLASQPITIRVVKESGASSDINGLALTMDLSEAKPYKNEPVFLTVRLVSQVDVTNVAMQPIQIADAIVEADGDPQVSRKLIDGVRTNVIEFRFLVTPLKAGPLKIPSVSLQGGIPIRRKTGSFFDDEFFSMTGFERLKPFALTTAETVIDIQPPVAGINPWLPARSLKLIEIWDDSQPLQEGEPVALGYKIVAEGLPSSQLPSLEEQIRHPYFKTYADKPEIADEFKEGRVYGWRKEQFTLIPQKAGALTLPEVSIAWWDVVKKEKVVAKIPARTLQVLPGMHSTAASAAPAEKALPAPAPLQETNVARDPLLYAFIAALALLLLLAIFWALSLERKIARLKPIPAQAEKTPAPVKKRIQAAKKDKKEKLPDLNPT